jgi:Ca-activated chloride channel family protein
VRPVLFGFGQPGQYLVDTVLAALTEWIHGRRVRRIAALAFGPSLRPAPWARGASVMRIAACAMLAWGLTSLLSVEPRRYASSGKESGADDDYQHILLVLDVSPSMRLVDAGPKKEISRIVRARELMESFFDRVPLDRFRVSVIAVYNGAKAVVVDTKDVEVVRNILGDLPMHYAFPAGKTKLFDGLAEAAKLAKLWEPNSATLILLSDGDTVPTTGMPRMPASIRSTLIVGVGDPLAGKFIDGRQSRQDVPTMRQIAARLGGTFHNGNEKQLASGLIAESTGMEDDDVFQRLTRREYALLASLLGALILSLLPILLHFFGTSWHPGASTGGDSRGDSRRTAASRRGATAPEPIARVG